MWYYYYMNPYYYWFAPPAFDPMALMYVWLLMWSYWLYTAYYIEMFKVMLDTWKKLAETMAVAPKPSP